MCWFCVAEYLLCFLWIPLLIWFLDLRDSSFSHVTSEMPTSATELRLHGHIESPGFGLRQHFVAERKWALGLQVTFIWRSPCNFLKLNYPDSSILFFVTVSSPSTRNNNGSAKSPARTKCLLEKDWTLQHEMQMESWLSWVWCIMAITLMQNLP
jgi:hypothetical protein